MELDVDRGTSNQELLILVGQANRLQNQKHGTEIPKKGRYCEDGHF